MLSLFTWFQLAARRVARSEEGQGLTEYVLILWLIALVVTAAERFLGGHINSALSTVASSV